MYFPTKSIRTWLAFAALGLPGFLASPAQAQAYKLTDLGTLGGPFSNGTAVNNRGQVTGEIYVTSLGAYHAFLTKSPEAQPHDLGTLGGANSFSFALNDWGQVTGSAYPTGTGSHAFLTRANGKMLRDLGTLGGTYSVGYGVNDFGQVGGYSTETGDGTYHAFVSGRNGGALHDLGTLGGNDSYGLGINAWGQVTGESETALGNTHAFLSQPEVSKSGSTGPDGQLRDLGTLGGTESRGIGVNLAGQVTGYSGTADNQTHAFLSRAHGGALKDLGTLGGSYSVGTAVNDEGQVVGFSTVDQTDTQFAFLFSHGKMINLNSLISPEAGFVLNSASGISDTGFITGTGTTADGRQDAFLLTPITGEKDAN